MGREKNIIFPSLQRALTQLGENIRLARLRRTFSTVLIAKRAGISRNTLRSIERGDASVSLGAYANVLQCLGLENDLRKIAEDDELGRKIQDIGLPVKARAPKRGQSRQRAKNKNEKTHE